MQISGVDEVHDAEIRPAREECEGWRLCTLSYWSPTIDNHRCLRVKIPLTRTNYFRVPGDGLHISYYPVGAEPVMVLEAWGVVS